MRGLMSVLFSPRAQQVTKDSRAGWVGTSSGWIPPNTAGVRVTHETALTLAPVFSAVSTIANIVAMLPWRVMRRLPGGGREVVLGPITNLLHSSPNENMGAFTWRQIITAMALLWGNGYAEIVRDAGGRPIELLLIHPSRVTPRRLPDTMEMVYEVRNFQMDSVVLPARDMFHLRGLGDDLQGQSIVRLAARTMGLAIAAEEYGAAFFGNGAQLGGIITGKDGTGKAGDQRVINLLKSFNRKHRGAANAFKVEYLDAGMDYDSIGVPPNEAQFLETRKFETADIARWFNLPPHEIGHLENAIKANVEDQSRSLVRKAILPWVRPLEQEADRKLLGLGGGGRYTRMDLNMLMRGDSKARAEFYKTLISLGVMSPNEARAREDMNPAPGGDVYLVMANMTTLEQVGRNLPQSAPPAALAGTFDRMLAREGHRAADAAARYKKRADFLSWLDRFYRQHVHHMRRELTTALTEVGLWGDEARQELVDFLMGHVEESKALVMDAYDDGTVPQWCDESRRARDQAARLLEQITDARAVSVGEEA